LGELALLLKQEFSTSQLPSHLSDAQRYSLWREMHFSEVAAVDVGVSEMPFHATLEATVIGSLVYAKMAGSIDRVTRSPHSIRAATPDRYHLVMNVGSSTIGGRYRDKDVAMSTGSALLAGTEVQDFRGGPSNNWVSLVLPSKLIEDKFARFEDRHGSLIQADNEALGLLRNYLMMLDSMSAPAGSGLVEHISTTLVDLVGLATGAKGDDAELAGTRGLRAGRLQAILDQIRNNYRNPTLSAPLVGLQLGLSARYVQDLLAQTGTGFSERLLELRLQDAKSMLTDPRYLDRRIGDIALEVGFGDISYFNRSFKRRFGCSPSAAR
jgi:AraC-like DNA-binding protein